MTRAYLDWNATAPLRPEARAAMTAAFDLPGNPSSVHAEGRAARRVVEEARAQVAALVGAEPSQVVFTSGGTEANALALTPLIEVDADKAPRDRLLISAIEHPSVRSAGRFPAAEEIAVERSGVVSLAALKAGMARGGRALVSIMLANNESGVVQPISEAARIVHEAGGLLHVDAVQAAGKIPVDMQALGVDMMSLAAHKIGGPKGIGALIRREGIHFPDPLIKGGGQERGLRGGTESVTAIAGFGAAAAAAGQSLGQQGSRMAALRDRFEAWLKATYPAAVIFGEGAPRLPNTSLFAVPGVKAETGVVALDLAGVAVSSGSACSSGKVHSSHVLAAMAVDPDLAHGSIRLSLGWESDETGLEAFQNAWIKYAESLGKGRGLAA